MSTQQSGINAAHVHVAIVDDDHSVRRALTRLLQPTGYSILNFSCAQELLDSPALDNIGCLILDMQLPDLSGLEVQSALDELGHAPAIIFLTGYGDIPMTVHAMRAGAVDFLTKPCSPDALLDAVNRGLELDALQRSQRMTQTAEHARLAALTQREHEVLRGITNGLRNKQIAAELDICEKTVKVHRAHIMEKVGVRSVAELVRIAEHVIGGIDSDHKAPVISGHMNA